MNRIVLSLPVMMLLVGCGPSERMQGFAPGGGNAPSPIVGSIFPSDLARIGNDQIVQVLEGRIPMKEGGNLALLPIGNMYYVDSGNADAFNGKIKSRLVGNKYVGEVCRVPHMLLVDKIDVPQIREIGARLQCENVLVYTSYDNYRYRAHLFAKDEIRASLTVEAVLVNVRTGCMPIALMVDEEVCVSEKASDDDRYEFVRRAQRECLEAGLMKACDRIDRVLCAVR